jgi:hypothetical protein
MKWRVGVFQDIYEVDLYDTDSYAATHNYIIINITASVVHCASL